MLWIRFSGVAAVSLILALGGASTAFAQSLRSDDGPAEIPPASFTASQYVDSKGCVYIRAGFDGSVTWVPRVGRDRKVVCGFEPTRVAGAGAASPAPAPTPVPRAPAPRTIVSAPPATAPVYSQPRTVTATPMPTTTVTIVPTTTVTIVPSAPVPSGGSACPGMSDMSSAYLQPNGRHAVRCGPQAESPYGGHGSSSLGRPVGPPITPPPGYRTVFEDDRLNPYRGIQTLEGFTQMSQVWTQELPRRLIEPGLPAASQRVVVSGPNGTTAEALVIQGSRAALANARLSTKGEPPTSAVPSEARYVQVGLFGNDANARAAIERLRAAGLPVKVANVTRGGKPHQIVVAGPFVGTADLNAGLTAARRAGFTDAFARD